MDSAQPRRILRQPIAAARADFLVRPLIGPARLSAVVDSDPAPRMAAAFRPAVPVAAVDSMAVAAAVDSMAVAAAVDSTAAVVAVDSTVAAVATVAVAATVVADIAKSSA